MATNVGNIDNVKSGPVLLYFDDGSGWRLIGLTKGDVKFATDPKYKDRVFHQTGETIMGKRMTALNGTVKFTVGEETHENLKMAMPYATVYTDGDKTAIGAGMKSGFDVLESAGRLRIHPINELGTDGDDDPSYTDNDVTIWKVANAKGVERTFTSSDDRVFDVEMDMYPDTTKPAAYCLFVEGDLTVVESTLIAPVVSTVEAEVSDSFTEVPVGGLSSVDTDSQIRVTFSKDMKEHMAESGSFVSLILDSTKAEVAVTAVYDSENKRVVLTPDSALTGGAVYSVVIAGVQDTAGLSLETPVLRSFTVTS